MFKVIEAFSGIGSQAQALANIGIDFEIQATVEWDIAAIYAYDIIHNGPQDLSNLRHHTKTSLLNELSKYSLSNDGSTIVNSIGLASMGTYSLKSLLYAILRTNNLVDITKVKASQLPEETDLLTYSFPCQDLSIAGIIHNNNGGIDKDANNRSSLLWEIQRLLLEYNQIGKELPKFLLMENVSNILSAAHIDNFKLWQQDLESLGYINIVWTLDARDFGVPQSRKRTFMLSVQVDEKSQELVESYSLNNNLENISFPDEMKKVLGDYLCLDYSNDIYRYEAIESTPAFTPSREKIYYNNEALAVDDMPNNDRYARTITTKQDRHPNSGIVHYENIQLAKHNTKYRNLTGRECLLLMGFPEDSVDLLRTNNPAVASDRDFLSNQKLMKLAGNSIVVEVLEVIFKFIINLDSLLKGEEEIYDLSSLYKTQSIF